MFGYITPNLNKLDESEKARYQGVYCGLCHSLRDNYSNISRLALSYDLTFLVLLLSSLYEPQDKTGFCNCIFHPGKKFTSFQNKFSDYCADLTVALAYHKILDDVNDEAKLKAKIGEQALRKQYNKVKNKHTELCDFIQKAMDKITLLENQAKQDSSHRQLESGDEIAKTFGLVMAKIFTPYDDVFADDMAKLGANLGRFIYFMDAACDLQDDIKNDAYNPYRFYASSISQLDDKKTIFQIKDQLMVLAGQATTFFEKLPLEQDINILRNILYEGSWLTFNYKYLKDN